MYYWLAPNKGEAERFKLDNRNSFLLSSLALRGGRSKANGFSLTVYVNVCNPCISSTCVQDHTAKQFIAAFLFCVNLCLGTVVIFQ